MAARPVPLVTGACELGQVRKEAAVAVRPGTGVRLVRAATHFAEV